MVLVDYSITDTYTQVGEPCPCCKWFSPRARTMTHFHYPWVKRRTALLER